MATHSAIQLSSDLKAFANDDKTRCDGIVIDNKKGDTVRQYIPNSELVEFWTPGRVEEACNILGIDLPIQTVREHHLRLLSTLLLTADNHCTHVKERLDDFRRQGIVDVKLPLSRDVVGSIFSDAPKDADAFYSNQFLFSPANMDTNLWDLPLGPELILPLKFIGQLQDGGLSSQSVSKYARYEGSKPSESDFVVIKIFPPHALRATFRDEVQLYRELQDDGTTTRDYKRPSEYFLSCYGTFQQNGFGAIVLEYANGGSLLDYFRKTTPPQNRDGLCQFYNALLDLPRAVFTLSNVGSSGYTHQDIKPGNIFVFCDTTGSGTPKIRLKLGDFGMSSKLIVGPDSEPYSHDNQATLAYSAPELMVQDVRLRDRTQRVSQPAEIWAVGCVMIESLTWAVRGEAARGAFAWERHDEIAARHQSMSEIGYAFAFHDGQTILDAVKTAALEISKSVCEYDKYTKRIVDLLTTDVLRPTPRKAGDYISGTLQDVLDGKAVRIKKRSVSNGARSPIKTAKLEPPAQGSKRTRSSWEAPPPHGNAHHPCKHHHLDSYAPAAWPGGRGTELATAADGGAVHDAARPSTVGSGSVALADCPHPDITAESLYNYHKGGKMSDRQGKMRSFLNDVNSSAAAISMALHKLEVEKVVIAITYAVKRADPDGIELYFTSNSTTGYRVTSVKSAKAVLRKWEGKTDCSNRMAATLKRVLDRVTEKAQPDQASKSPWKALPLAKTQKPAGASVLVLTNGVWGASPVGGLPSAPGDGRLLRGGQSPSGNQARDWGLCGVDDCIRNFFSSSPEMAERRGLLYATVQFISFGNSVDGLERLKYLDDCLGLKYDMVDTKSHKAPLWSILMGSLDPDIDSWPARGNAKFRMHG
ncbi:hypothetical protein MCOR01_010433 [Pyricularia oryzae]|nr:hypothetical protein MCOR01_010433 [Pyricularia oryzae]